MKNNYKQKSVTLVITHKCNLNCIYCYEKYKNNDEMLTEKALNIVYSELTCNDGYDYIEFDFMGGEPFLKFDLIKDVVEKSLKIKTKKDFIFFATTNGTILKNEWKDWLVRYKEYFQVSLSLDGTKDMHDINRSNSYDLIDINFFTTTYPCQPVKMTISNLTLSSLSKGIINFIEKDINFTCNFAYGINWEYKENILILRSELRKIVDYYLNHPEIMPNGFLDPERILSISELTNDTYRVCGAGLSNIAYDFDGEKYPCQYFLPLSIGKDKALESKKIIFPRECIKETINDCANCFLRNVCFICFGSNFSDNGNIYKINKNMCFLFKEQFKAIAYLSAKMFEKGTLEKFYGDSTPWILKSTIIINDHLNINNN